MVKLQKIFTLFVLFFIETCVFATPTQSIGKIWSTFEAQVEKSLKDWKAPGCAIAIIEDGKIVKIATWGTQSAGQNKPITPSTPFQIASLSKAFLATTIAKLVDLGLLSFDDPVRKYLPDFFVGSEETSQKITIRDLLLHRSGLPGFSGDTLMHLGFSKNEIIQGLRKMPQTYPLGERYAYQNFLFAMLGDIAEKVTGKTIKDMYQEFFFTPLNFKSAAASLEDIGQKNGIFEKIKSFFTTNPKAPANPHDIFEGKTHVMPFNPEVYTFPASTGISISIEDLAQWVIFQMNETQGFLKPETFAQMVKPYISVISKHDTVQFPPNRISNNHYGMGWFLFDYDSGHGVVPMRSHMGAISGVRSLIACIPGTKTALVILSNLGSLRVSTLPEQLRDTFFDLYFNHPNKVDWSQHHITSFKEIREKNKEYYADERRRHPRPHQALEKFIGTFLNDVYGELKIEKNGKNLEMHYRGRIVPLKHWNGDTFTYVPQNLSTHYGDGDSGMMDFGSMKGSQIDACAMHALNEGKDKGVFHRIK